MNLHEGAGNGSRKHRISDAVIHDGRAPKKSHRRDQPPHGSFEFENGPITDVNGAAGADDDEHMGGESEYDETELDEHALNLISQLPRLPGVAATDTAEWQRTIERVVRNVVSIRFCQTCSFDTDEAITSEATGFVVDPERGYIMTNRHVVCAGPFWGYCVFDNHEEVCSILSSGN